MSGYIDRDHNHHHRIIIISIVTISIAITISITISIITIPSHGNLKKGKMISQPPGPDFDGFPQQST